MAENQLIQEVSIHALAHLAETRDPETGNHLRRTQEYVRTLARGLKHHPRFSHYLDERTIGQLAQSAPLHDIGKVGIPDHILLKPGKLTPEEWAIMKTHAEIGAEAIAQAIADSARPVEFLQIAQEIARGHHEKWDGSGYPRGLAGDGIPISARLMAGFYALMEEGQQQEILKPVPVPLLTASLFASSTRARDSAITRSRTMRSRGSSLSSRSARISMRSVVALTNSVSSTKPKASTRISRAFSSPVARTALSSVTNSASTTVSAPRTPPQASTER